MMMGDCLGTDEIFTHVNDDGSVIHVNASAMERAAENAVRNGVAEVIETEFDVEFIEFIKVRRGVEQWKIDRLGPMQLAMPCIGVWLPDGSCLTVDGHHRIVRNFEEGKKTYIIIIFQHSELSKYCIDNVPAELTRAIAIDTIEQKPTGPSGIWVPPNMKG